MPNVLYRESMPDGTVKISIGSVSMQASSHVTSSIGGVFLVAESADVDRLSIEHHACAPFFSLLIPGNPSVWGGASCSTADVLPIPLPGGDPKIGSTVVQSVPIDVVPFQAISDLKAKKQAVHLSRMSGTSDTAQGVSPCAQAPSPLVDPRGISLVNDGVRSDAAIPGTERNQDCAIGCGRGIMRLHRVPPVPCAKPRPALTGAGTFCVNYTPSLRAEAA